MPPAGSTMVAIQIARPSSTVTGACSFMRGGRFTRARNFSTTIASPLMAASVSGHGRPWPAAAARGDAAAPCSGNEARGSDRHYSHSDAIGCSTPKRPKWGRARYIALGDQRVQALQQAQIQLPDVHGSNNLSESTGDEAMITSAKVGANAIVLLRFHALRSRHSQIPIPAWRAY